MNTKAKKYIESAVLWSKDSKSILKALKDSGQGDSVEYAMAAASISTYQVLQGIALLLDESNEDGKNIAHTLEVIRSTQRLIDAELAAMSESIEDLRAVVSVGGERGVSNAYGVSLDGVESSLNDIGLVVERLERLLSNIASNVIDIKQDVSYIEDECDDMKSDTQNIRSLVWDIAND